MGRKKIPVNPLRIIELVSQGKTQEEIAEELGISTVTIARRMGEIRAKQGILLSYRALQGFHLTELQAAVLNAITPERLANASLLEIVKAFQILKTLELSVEGKPSKVKGLLAYLEELEREESAANSPRDENG
ncbi:MAG: helix-turn-helix domain-containing protein [Syntrophobacteraceae bacterium]|jgi:transcriptional regulator with XRE-family HTH domain